MVGRGGVVVYLVGSVLGRVGLGVWMMGRGLWGGVVLGGEAVWGHAGEVVRAVGRWDWRG